MDVHIVASAVRHQVEDLAELEWVGAVVDLDG